MGFAREEGLDEEGEGEEGGEGGVVGEGVEAVGGSSGGEACEPALEEGGGGGECEVGEAERGEEQEQDVADGLVGVDGFPAVGGDDGEREQRAREQEGCVERGLRSLRYVEK